VQDKNLHLPGRAELQTELDSRCPLCGLLRPEFLGGAAAPPYQGREDFCPALCSGLLFIMPRSDILLQFRFLMRAPFPRWRVFPGIDADNQSAPLLRHADQLKRKPAQRDQVFPRLTP
jgi:hypothetical protein